jgi:hypothetical protein
MPKLAKKTAPGDRNLNVRFDAETCAALGKAVEKEKESLSTIVRMAVREKLKATGYLR